MNTEPDGADHDRWRHGHEAARELREAMMALGVPEHEVTTVTAREDARGVIRVTVPPLTVQSTLLMLAAWGPYLGPRWIGRRDGSPTAPGRPA